jgi:hypothetical protein
LLEADFFITSITNLKIINRVGITAQPFLF